MSQIIEACKKYFRCVKLNMRRVVQNCTTPPKIGLRQFWQYIQQLIIFIFAKYITQSTLIFSWQYMLVLKRIFPKIIYNIAIGGGSIKYLITYRVSPNFEDDCFYFFWPQFSDFNILLIATIFLYSPRPAIGYSTLTDKNDFKSSIALQGGAWPRGL